MYLRDAIDNLECTQREAKKTRISTITYKEQLKKLRIIDLETQHAMYSCINSLREKFNIFSDVPESRTKCKGWELQQRSFEFDRKEHSNKSYSK